MRLVLMSIQPPGEDVDPDIESGDATLGRCDGRPLLCLVSRVWLGAMGRHQTQHPQHSLDPLRHRVL